MTRTTWPYIYIASIQLLASVYQPFPVRLLCHVFWSHCCVGSAIPLNSIEGGAHMRFMYEYSWIYEAQMSPALYGSSVIWRFEGKDVIEIETTFDFYTGLPHIHSSIITNLPTSCLRQHTGFSYQANSLDSIDSTTRSPAKNITGLLC